MEKLDSVMCEKCSSEEYPLADICLCIDKNFIEAKEKNPWEIGNSFIKSLKEKGLLKK